jgi:hypothetical protein
MLRRDDLDLLLRDPRPPAVSVYLPTHVAGREIRQDPIRLRNLLDAVRAGLADAGLRTAEADELLEPLRALERDGAQWRHMDRGLALFRAPDLFVQHRVPLEVPELALVGSSFHVKPLLPALEGEGEFRLLTLTKGGVGLFRADRLRIEEEPLDGLPAELSPTASMTEGGTDVVWHAGGAAAVGGEAFARYEAAGEGELADAELRDWLGRLRTALAKRIAGDRLPLAVVGPSRLVGHLAALGPVGDRETEWLVGTPEGLERERLHALAAGAVRPLLLRARDRALAELRPGAPLSAWEIAEVVAASAEGRVDRLFTASDAEVWGRVDPASGRAFPHHAREPGDADLLDRAAALALLSGARVHALPKAEMPEGRLVAARLRW